jgi:hypothetical protein
MFSTVLQQRSLEKLQISPDTSFGEKEIPQFKLSLLPNFAILPLGAI